MIETLLLEKQEIQGLRSSIANAAGVDQARVTVEVVQ